MSGEATTKPTRRGMILLPWAQATHKRLLAAGVAAEAGWVAIASYNVWGAIKMLMTWGILGMGLRHWVYHIMLHDC